MKKCQVQGGFFSDSHCILVWFRLLCSTDCGLFRLQCVPQEMWSGWQWVVVPMEKRRGLSTYASDQNTSTALSSADCSQSVECNTRL